MVSKKTMTLNYIRHTLSLVYESSPKWTLINAVLTMIRGFIPLILLYVVKQLVDIVSLSQKGAYFNTSEVYYTLSLVGFFFIINAVSGSLSKLVRERQSHFVNDYIQKLIHHKTVRLPYKYFEDSKYQDLFFRAVNEANYRPSKIFYGLLGLLQNLITLCIVLIVLITFHWSIVPILLCAAIPIIIFRLFYAKKEYRIKQEHTEDERKMHYFNRLLVAKDFAKEVRIFNLSSTFQDSYTEIRNQLRAKQWRISKSKTWWETLVQTLSTSLILFIFYFIISKALKGSISNGAMAMYFLALQRGYAVLQELLSRMASLFEDNLFLRNFFEFQQIELPKERNRIGQFPKPIKKSIQLSSVEFKYPNTERSVFKNLNFSIPAGKTVALVGENGSGKTTLVKLLAGLYQPSSGEIKIDDVNLNDIHPTDLAENVSIIFQDFMLYNVSADDNIRFGNVNREYKKSNIIDAAINAGIHEVFSNLKEAYDTPLGTLFKDSEMLSRGEWQRTALARSFYNQAQVIILDEPTSSLDAYTEAKLISHFKSITSNRTAIIVSHRLTTINLADIIIVLKDGEITEMGPYQELLDLKGEFHRMVKSYTQA